MGNKGTKTFFESAAFLLQFLGIVWIGATLILAYFEIVPMDLPLFCTLVGLGLGFITIGLFYMGHVISLSSKEQMKALTNLNYYEKMAMLEGYKTKYAIHTTDAIKRDLEKVHYDIKAVTALRKWMGPKKIEELKRSACETATYVQVRYPGSEYKDSITKLKKTAEGDASENEDI
jgi:hypothetical protein